MALPGAMLWQGLAGLSICLWRLSVRGVGLTLDRKLAQPVANCVVGASSILVRPAAPVSTLFFWYLYLGLPLD